MLFVARFEQRRDNLGACQGNLEHWRCAASHETATGHILRRLDEEGC